MKFHQCVKLNKFENERVINFIPPDGEFELISYRIDSVTKPLFNVELLIESESERKIQLNVKVISNYKEKCVASLVKLLIPIPSDINGSKFQCSNGNATINSERECIEWVINQM